MASINQYLSGDNGSALGEALYALVLGSVAAGLFAVWLDLMGLL